MVNPTVTIANGSNTDNNNNNNNSNSNPPTTAQINLNSILSNILTNLQLGTDGLDLTTQRNNPSITIHQESSVPATDIQTEQIVPLSSPLGSVEGNALPLVQNAQAPISSIDNNHSLSIGQIFQQLNLISRKKELEKRLSTLLENPTEDIQVIIDEIDAINMAISFNPIPQSLQTEILQNDDDFEDEQIPLAENPNPNSVENNNLDNQDGEETNEEEDAMPATEPISSGAQAAVLNGVPVLIMPAALGGGMNGFPNPITANNVDVAQMNNFLQNLNAVLQQHNNAWQQGDQVSEDDDNSVDDDDMEEPNPMYVDYNANQQLEDVPIPLPQEKLNELQIIPFSTQMKYQKCCVCMDEFSEPDPVRVLFCDHVYHPNCIDEWFKGHPNCPVCDLDQRIRGTCGSP